MIRFVFKLIFCLLLALGVGLAFKALRSGDPFYTLYEWISPARFQQYDGLIKTVAREHDLDPMLIKAVVWRESRFDPQKVGTAGERGLMQVTEKAAREWADESRVDKFEPDQLFDPKTNLEAGSWYLQRAIKHWNGHSNPIPFALAEYNAGASRAQRWSGGSSTVDLSSDDFLRQIDFPSTRKYVDSITERYRFYKKRGRM